MDLDQLRIASPCHMDWHHMTGDERVRFCDSCSLHVYNFSELTSPEIKSLIMRTEGRLCGRLYKRADGTIITRDCPVGLKAIRRKVARIAGAAFATVLSACSFVFAQNQKKECKDVPAITIERKKPDHDHSPGLTGIVRDPLGAVIPGATVTLFDGLRQKLKETQTSDTGEFTLVGIPDGTYSIEVSSPSFVTLKMTSLELHSNEIASASVVLNANESTVFVGLLAAPIVMEKRGGTTTFSGDLLRKLPIND